MTRGGFYTGLRFYENIALWLPDGVECVGKYDIPRILPVDMPEISSWIPFNQCMNSDATHKGVHMFIEDYQIQRLWNRPTQYVDVLRRAACVCSPDFSIYTDVPQALNIYNHYRKHWLAAWWQQQGLTVIPTICWGDESTFAWCFDGEPRRSVVAVSSIGTQRHPEDAAAFMMGYDAMLERLKPETILFYGNVPSSARGNIVPVETFHEQMRRRCNR